MFSRVPEKANLPNPLTIFKGLICRIRCSGALPLLQADCNDGTNIHSDAIGAFTAAFLTYHPRLSIIPYPKDTGADHRTGTAAVTAAVIDSRFLQ